MISDPEKAAGDALDDLSMCDTLPAPASTAASDDTAAKEVIPRDFFFIPVPRYLRHNPKEQVRFNLWLNLLFAFATTFIVANMFWCQPILIELADAFNVSFEKISNIPTVLQAGYATGMLLIAPLGDLVRRRPLVLMLSFTACALTFGVAFTNNFVTFQVISFFVGVATCVPQILIPLAADLAPPARRATAISIVISGLLLGILIARVVAGLIGQFVTWRVVFYLAIGLQGFIFFLLYFLMPDFPAVKNGGVTYWRIIYSMLKFAVTEPLLVQASLVCFASMACFTNFWVTLTFLLGGTPYFYSTLVIGLFGLVGMFGVLMAPLVGRLVDNLVPWLATLIATVALILFQAVQTGAGGVHIAAVIIVCFGIDVFRQMQQVSLTSAVFSIDPKARSRLNAIILISVFMGQIMGTSVGTKVFVKFGWRPAAALSVAWTGFTLVVMLVRGPHCSRYTWFGYEGGWNMRKRPASPTPETAAAAAETHTADSSQDEENAVEKVEALIVTEGSAKKRLT